jgi:hypothetical protein
VLKFFVNGSEYVEDISLGENRQTQEQIDAVLGMSFTLFSAHRPQHDLGAAVPEACARRPARSLRGTARRDPNQRRADTLKKLMGTTKDSLRQEEANINAAQGVNARVQQRDCSGHDQARPLEHRPQEPRRGTGAQQIEELSIIDFDKREGDVRRARCMEQPPARPCGQAPDPYRNAEPPRRTCSRGP